MTVISPVSMGFAIPTGAIAALIFIMAVWRAPWSQLLNVQIRQHLWLGSIYALCLAWSFMKISLGSVIIAHPLIMSACTIVFGIPLALVCGFFALIISQFIVDASWYNTGFNYISSVVIPCFITGLVLFGISKINIRNLFIFILGSGFFGGMLSIITSATISVALLWLFQPELFNAAKNFTQTYILLIYPEGFCNGVIVISLSVMKPHLVKTYNEGYYLDGRSKD